MAQKDTLQIINPSLQGPLKLENREHNQNKDNDDFLLLSARVPKIRLDLSYLANLTKRKQLN